MDEVPIFESGSVIITPSVARFGEMSYQIGNIGSIMLHEGRTLGFLTTVLLIFGVLGVLLGFLQNEIRILIAGITSLFGSALSQNHWPSLKYTIWLRTNCGDIPALQSFNKDEIAAVKRALDEAFFKRKGFSRSL